MERGRSSKSRKEIAKEYRSSNVNSLFIAEEALKRREQSYNERGRDGLWTCDMPGCEVKFDRLKKKEYHWRRVHKKERLFECGTSVCEASFFDKSDLTRHENDIHKNVRFDCPKCDKSYSRQWYLSKHLEKNHGEGSRNSNRRQRRS